MLRHITCIDTPQQNGLAERMNRTSLNKVKSMLADSGLNKRFWVEAIATTYYLISKSPSVALNFKTPKELWSNGPPQLNHLRPFGCLAYIYTS